MPTSLPRGRLDTNTLKQLVADSQIETVLAVFPDLYGRLMGKRISGRFFVESMLADDIHACDYLLACDMEMDPVPGYAFTNWASGYGDVRLRPDMATLRQATWLDKTAIVLCDVYDEEAEVLVDLAPRSLLRRQVEKAAESGLCAHGRFRGGILSVQGFL